MSLQYKKSDSSFLVQHHKKDIIFSCRERFPCREKLDIDLSLKCFCSYPIKENILIQFSCPMLENVPTNFPSNKKKIPIDFTYRESSHPFFMFRKKFPTGDAHFFFFCKFLHYNILHLYICMYFPICFLGGHPTF